MLEEEIREYMDDCGVIYYRYWLCDSAAGNRNRLRWLYDEE